MSQSVVPPFNILASHNCHPRSQNLFAYRPHTLIPSQIAPKKEVATKAKRSYAPPIISLYEGHDHQIEAPKISTTENPLSGFSPCCH
ncbi:hypothetical protein LINGRAHAP2_LOCUS23928 [Linum grandiflorum]